MTIPKVAIVGRPNVGKSSILNWLARKRLAIVDNVAGVTRDRLSFVVESDPRPFELVDTGGIGINDVDNLDEEIERQIEIGITQADLILLVVDARAGLAPLDQEVIRRLRRVDKPLLCVANKADTPPLDAQAGEFHKLGCGEVICISTKTDRNRDRLIEQIVERLPAETDEAEREEPVMKVAIVGRRNVGKSTLVNSLAQTERMIVSEVPGTTRDSVDVRFELDGKTFVAIDTPGLRRTKSRKSDIDFYGTLRAERSIRRADVVLMLFDAMDEISNVDKQLCNYIEQQFKPCLFVVNKWDLAEEKAFTEAWGDYLQNAFPTLWHVPIAFITAKTGKNVKKLINHAQMLFKQSRSRIGTGELNRLIRRAMEHHPPPLHGPRRPKIYYATQIDVQPPTIVLVCNDPAAFSNQYKRYLLSVLYDQLEFGEVPIRLRFNRREQEDHRDEIQPEQTHREPKRRTKTSPGDEDEDI